jgi:hypothetical protein
VDYSDRWISSSPNGRAEVHRGVHPVVLKVDRMWRVRREADLRVDVVSAMWPLYLATFSVQRG